MKRQQNDNAADLELLSTEGEVKSLLNTFEIFLLERDSGQPVKLLNNIVSDMRVIVGRLVTEHFLHIGAEREPNFCAMLATLLSERAAALPDLENEDDYVEYCVNEILAGFEYAQEIKATYPGDLIMQRILAVDIPILRPFDYGVRKHIRLVKS